MNIFSFELMRRSMLVLLSTLLLGLAIPANGQENSESQQTSAMAQSRAAQCNIGNNLFLVDADESQRILQQLRNSTGYANFAELVTHNAGNAHMDFASGLVVDVDEYRVSVVPVTKLESDSSVPVGFYAEVMEPSGRIYSVDALYRSLDDGSTLLSFREDAKPFRVLRVKDNKVTSAIGYDDQGKPYNISEGPQLSEGPSEINLPAPRWWSCFSDCVRDLLPWIPIEICSWLCFSPASTICLVCLLPVLALIGLNGWSCFQNCTGIELPTKFVFLPIVHGSAGSTR